MRTRLQYRWAVRACLVLLLGPALAQASAAQPEPEAAIFHVFGLVADPGAYAWSDGVTVKDAVALAGGYKEDGSKDELEIQRMADGRLVSTVATEDDALEPDDVVMVRGARPSVPPRRRE